jgi:hypothetical protein
MARIILKFTLSDSDTFVKQMQAIKPGTYTVTPEKVQLIKSNYELLKWYDDQHDYIFNEELTKIKKVKL